MSGTTLPLPSATMLRRVLVLLSVLAATACGHARTGLAPAPIPDSPSIASTLGAGDVFEVRVFQEPELSGVYQVGPQGDVI